MIWPRLIWMLVRVEDYAEGYPKRKKQRVLPMHDDDCCIAPALHYVTYGMGVETYMDHRTEPG